MSKAMEHPTLYLSANRTLYVGQLDKPFQFSNHPPVFMCSLAAPLDVRHHSSGDLIAQTNSVLIPTGVDIVVETNGPIAHSCLDFLSRDFDSISQSFSKSYDYDGKTVFSAHENQSGIKALMMEAQKDDIDALVLFEKLNPLLDPCNQASMVDPRIDKAVELIRTNIERFCLEEIAHHVNLSVPRLTQLFKQESGVTMRRLKMWHMVYVATVLFSIGRDLSDAACFAGYSDYAHFSKSVFELCGHRPSDVLSDRKRVKIHTMLAQELAEHRFLGELNVPTT